MKSSTFVFILFFGTFYFAFSPSLHMVNGETNNTSRKVLLEFYGTELCPYVPGGIKKMTNVLQNPELRDKVIWVSHHVGRGEDFMTVQESRDLLKFTNGTPTYMLDRTPIGPAEAKPLVQSAHWITEEGMLSDIQKALAVPTDISINIQNTINVTTRELTVNIAGEATGTIPLDELFIHICVVEDGVKSSNQNGFTGVFTHNNILRKMINNGSKGTKLNWNENSYHLSSTTILDESWNLSNMRIVAFIAKSHTNSVSNVNVINAQVSDFNLSTSVDKIRDDSFYPFSHGGKVFVQNNGSIEKIYTMNGREVFNNNISQGVYLVRIRSNDNRVIMRKIVI